MPSITIGPGRAFLPISTSGCGSGCKYCFISDPDGQPNYVAPAEIDASLSELLSSPDFSPGVNGTLLSLAPETEPMRGERSIALLNQYLAELLPLGNPIQIATKERVPTDWWEHVLDCAQLVLFTSFSTLLRAERIEPRAAAPNTRLLNFDLPTTGKARQVALIKPFLRQTARELEEFATAFMQHMPDAQCVGIQYVANKSDRSERLHHPLFEGWTSPPPSSLLHEFAGALRERLNIPTFHNSTCVSAYFLDRLPPRPIWRIPGLCVRCRDCPT